MNPFTDELTPEEERIVDLTLKHLKETKRERLDVLIEATASHIGREITEEEFEQHVCRIYLKIYRAGVEMGVPTTWDEIHRQIGMTPDV